MINVKLPPLLSLSLSLSLLNTYIHIVYIICNKTQYIHTYIYIFRVVLVLLKKLKPYLLTHSGNHLLAYSCYREIISCLLVSEIFLEKLKYLSSPPESSLAHLNRDQLCYIFFSSVHLNLQKVLLS